MRADVIIEHEDWQRLSLPRFLALHAVRNGVPPPPAVTEVEGQVLARVNYGRWIADCDCGGAIVVSSETPLFYCPNCGNRNNGGKWKAVVFPQKKPEIEAELLKRAASDGFRARTRNWNPEETVEDLKAEAMAKGVS